MSCPICKNVEAPQHVVLETAHWIVSLGTNQAYLGRAFVSARRHVGSLHELTPDEWQDFEQLLARLEIAYWNGFQARPMNWTCMMNNAFRTEPEHPHVHWHVWPRYKSSKTMFGHTFQDKEYGEHYSLTAEQIVDKATVEQIRQHLVQHLPDPLLA